MDGRGSGGIVTSRFTRSHPIAVAYPTGQEEELRGLLADARAQVDERAALGTGRRGEAGGSAPLEPALPLPLAHLRSVGGAFRARSRHQRVDERIAQALAGGLAGLEEIRCLVQ